MDRERAKELAQKALSMLGERVVADFTDTERVTGTLKEISVVEYKPDTYDVLVYVGTPGNREADTWECLVDRVRVI